MERISRLVESGSALQLEALGHSNPCVVGVRDRGAPRWREREL
jgi:hypothetical protein